MLVFRLHCECKILFRTELGSDNLLPFFAQKIKERVAMKEIRGSCLANIEIT